MNNTSTMRLPGPNPGESNQRAWRSDVIIGLILGCGLVCLSPVVDVISAMFAHESWRLSGEGDIVDAAYRVSLHDLPHIDFRYYYTGGWEIIVGQLFALFGRDLWVERVALGFVMGVIGFLVYLIQRALNIDRLTAALASLATTLYAFIFLFIIYPAWPAEALVVLAFLLLLTGLEKNRIIAVILAGVSLGIASSFKQTIGVFGVIGGMFTILVLQRDSDVRNLVRGQIRSMRFADLRMYLILALPALAFLLLVWITHQDMTVQVAAMLFPAPFFLALLATIRFAKMRIASAEARSAVVHDAERSLFALGAGFVLGFAPLLAFYLLHGHVHAFIDESFLSVNAIVAHKVRIPSYVIPDGTPIGLAALKGLPYFLPGLISIASLVVGVRRLNRKNADRLTVFAVLSASFIAMMNMMMYPEVHEIYLLFELPLLFIPVTLLCDVILKKLVKNPRARTFLPTGMFILLIGLRLIRGLMIGWPSWTDPGRISILDENAGRVHVRTPYALYITPVVHYLAGRPAEEHIVSFAKYGKVIGFLSGRRNDDDFGSRWGRRGPFNKQDFDELWGMISANHTPIIILEKEWTRNSPVSQTLHDSLGRYYRLAFDQTAFDSSGHSIYQRIEPESPR